MSIVNHVPLHVKIYPPQSCETMPPEGMKLFACAPFMKRTAGGNTDCYNFLLLLGKP